jgi:hypothetical protein
MSLLATPVITVRKETGRRHETQFSQHHEKDLYYGVPRSSETPVRIARHPPVRIARHPLVRTARHLPWASRPEAGLS